MNYKKTLKKVEKELKKENTKKTENRLIVMKNALKQIIREEYEIKNDIFTIDKAAELLKATPIIDINGQEHNVGIIDIHSHSLHISLCDPGDWLTADNLGLDIDVLTKASVEHIEKEIKKIIPGSIVSIGETHLTDVEFIIDVEGV